jgi:hypothetical protein
MMRGPWWDGFFAGVWVTIIVWWLNIFIIDPAKKAYRKVKKNMALEKRKQDGN